MASFKKKANGKVEITITHGTRFDGTPDRYYRTVEYVSDKQLEVDAALFLADIIKGNVVTSCNVSMESLYLHYLKNACGELKQATVARYKLLYNNQIHPYFGDRSIGKISRTDIRDWVKFLLKQGNRQNGKPLKPKTVKNALSLLSTIYNYAIYELELLDKNPCVRIKVPKSKGNSPVKKSLYTEADMKELIELLLKELGSSLDITHATILLMILFTGIRTGEAMGLEWKNVDFAKNQISIEKERVYISNVGVVEDTPKTDRSIRTISVPPFIMGMLRDLKDYQEKCKIMMGEEYHDSGYVAVTVTGEPQHPRNTYKWFLRFQEDHGLKRATVHDLRHTHVAMLSSLGVKIIDVSKRLGHSNTRITQEVYEYLFKDIDDSVSSELEEYYNDILG